jgi:hypothetical protein
MGGYGLDYLAQDWDMGLAFVNMVMNLGVSSNMGNFVTR